MTEIFFYHLEQAPLERVLPVLLEKSLERDWRAVVEVGHAERLDSLDTSLWTFRDDSFLPHAVAGGPADAEQPVLLIEGPDNPNRAQIRFFVDRAVPEAAGAPDSGYERLAYLFDGHDPDAVTEARAVWKSLRTDHQLTYWQQDGSGRWSKQA